MMNPIASSDRPPSVASAREETGAVAGPQRATPVFPGEDDGGRLLDDVLRQPARAREPAGQASRLDLFLTEPSPERALALWLGLTERTDPLPVWSEVLLRLDHDVAWIDSLLTDQVNAVIHHPAFQKLEASWRGLWYLTEKLPDDKSVLVRVLNVSWGELTQDMEQASEFDQSQLFRKVYEEEFGHAGGKPFGVLLGDYEIRRGPGEDYPYDDPETLSKVAGVAAAAFAPFVAAVHPSFFGLDSFTELEQPIDLERVFDQVDYLTWRRLRDSPDARFVGLTLPRVLMRLPYGRSWRPGESFLYREEVEGPDRSKYLWGNAAYAFGGVLIRSFANSSWLADIRGVRQATERDGTRTCQDGGGLVTGLPAHSFSTDREGVVTKCSTEVIITDSLEKELGELGFIPICHCYDTKYSAFYGSQSVQAPRTFTDPKATANARLSSMLQYMLCTSRFAHYIKVISRDLVGAMTGPEDCQARLHEWLRDYVTGNDNAGPEARAKHPLREAKVEVKADPNNPGGYSCVVYLRPHFELDQMFTSVRLTTDLAPGRSP
jgi:type VI secretion system ImpC/EvpB family protein